jgi:CheY-like chemotaxis protein
MQKLLGRLGYEADVVSTGVEVLEALDRQSYDLVLMDVQMPEMDGIEATRRIRARGGTGPRIVAMTANAMSGDREVCMQAGMDDYLPKPVELEELARVLGAMAANAAPRAARTDAGAANAPASPVLDRRRLAQLNRLQDDENPTLVADIIDMFVNDAPQHLGKLHEAIDAGDAAALKAVAHRFLSSIENLGAVAMRERCMAIEQLGREGRVDGAAPLLAALEEDFRHAQAALREAADEMQLKQS